VILEWLPLAVGLAVSVICVPLVRFLGFRSGRISFPRRDRWHRAPTPTLGGVGMFLAFAAAIGAQTVVTRTLPAPLPLLIGAGLSFALGLYDDFKQLTPPAKLAFQIAIAAQFVFGGYLIPFFPWPIANIALTIFWLVGITNAINLLDNMDGLAGGVALIAAGFLAFFNAQAGDLGLLSLSMALVGAMGGFLLFNFYPARIFMGDSGSLFLGFTLAALAVARQSQASSVLAVMGVPILIFLLPILETALVAITRVLRGQSPLQGGTDHSSHRLVAFGLTDRQAVLSLYGVTILSGWAAVFLEQRDYSRSLLLIPLVLILLSLFMAYLGRVKVVTGQPAADSSLRRLVASLTYRQRALEVVLDVLVFGVSYYLAFWVSFGLDMTPVSMGLYLQSWPAALICAYAGAFVCGVYRIAWGRISLDDWLRFGLAALLAGAACLLFVRIIHPDHGYPLEVYVLFVLFLFAGLGFSRASFQIFDRVFLHPPQKTAEQSVILYGAGKLGEIALQWLQHHPEWGYRPIAFLDDDAHLWGVRLLGLEIIGGGEWLCGLAEGQRPHLPLPRGVIVTCEAPSTAALDACRAARIWVRFLRLELEDHTPAG
jgi:UDP-GlcNAc:undecaprenyl-phosphate GlcNAc-1-phosphate transferase